MNTGYGTSSSVRMKKLIEHDNVGEVFFMKKVANPLENIVHILTLRALNKNDRFP